ncbi:MAG TPA: VIT domain-containing protein [Candidatus Methylomirabilis sp.]|nr:VIT domain-containing protein [Candidatus Methylomirabilis sp.]HSC71737.1 VIT domain-containing protein [Candidatus Methylomirabilis sp.]
MQGVVVEAWLRDLTTEVTITQRYRNAEANPIETVYVFPLEEGAAVCGFEAWIGSVHVVGEVMERNEAFDAYDDALAAGHGAYLLDQERPDIFTASIGNVPPGAEVVIRITYVAEATLEGDAIRFALPTTISPRYAPPEDRVGVGRPPAEAVNPPIALRVPYGLALTVTLNMPSAITAVASPSHPIAVALDGAEGSVELGAGIAAMDRDFVLLVTIAEAHAPRAWIERDGERSTVAALAFQPQFETSEAPSELIFVLDRSGSMEGRSIQEAKRALQLCLRGLREGCRFNVVGFGSTFALLFPESRPYTQESLETASVALAAMDADLGGTEILAPLRAILAKAPHPEVPRQLFILTDGQVSNTQAVIGLLRKHAHTTRVFTFGIGRGASPHLVRGMARAGHGAAEFIYPGERIEPKVLRQLKKALAPALTDVRVEWGGQVVNQAPSRVPPIFAGSRVLLYGFLPDDLPRSVTLRARASTGPVAYSIALESVPVEPGRLLATLAARILIRELEDHASEQDPRRGSRQRRGQPDRLMAEIVRLGTTYQLCSSHTSFVAIERRETPVGDEVQLRKVPAMLTHGWGGAEFMVMGDLTSPEAPILLMDALPPHRVDFPCGSAQFQGQAIRRPPLLDRLVALQRADGRWELSEELAAVLGKTLHDLESGMPAHLGSLDDARHAWATALAIAWLEVHQADRRDEWELLAQKAEHWLAHCSVELEGDGEWVGLARQYVP